MKYKGLLFEIGIVLILCLVSGVIGYTIRECPTCVGQTVVEIHDSIAPAKDTAKVIVGHRPTLVGVKKYIVRKENLQTVSKMEIVESNSQIKLDSSKDSFESSRCLDTNTYKLDSFLVDNFRASATATVTNNEVINMSIEWQNLKPEKWKVKSTETTKTAKPEIKEVEKKQSLVKIYTGLYGGLAIQNKTVASYHGGIGLDAIISDRHMIGLQGGLNSALQMEFGLRFGEKIRLKK